MMYAILIFALFAVWVLGFIAIIAFIKHEEWEDKGRWAEIILLLAWPALIAMGICLGFGQLAKKASIKSRQWFKEKSVSLRDKIGRLRRKK